MTSVLERTLSQVRAQIHRARISLVSDERQFLDHDDCVRTQLVSPILEALGWDIIPNEEDPTYCAQYELECANPGQAERDAAHAERQAKKALWKAEAAEERALNRADRERANARAGSTARAGLGSSQGAPP